MVLQDVTELGACLGRTQGMQLQNGLVRVLPQNHGGFCTPLIMGKLLNVLEEGTAAGLVLHRQETLGALAYLLSQLTEVAYAFQRHIVEVEREAQKEVRVEGPQIHVDQGVNGSLHADGVTNESRNSFDRQ